MTKIVNETEMLPSVKGFNDVTISVTIAGAGGGGGVGLNSGSFPNSGDTIPYSLHSELCLDTDVPDEKDLTVESMNAFIKKASLPRHYNDISEAVLNMKTFINSDPYPLYDFPSTEYRFDTPRRDWDLETTRKNNEDTYWYKYHAIIS